MAYTTEIYLFSHDSGSLKSEIKASAGLASPEVLFPWLVDGRLLHVFMYMSVSELPFYKDTNIAFGPILLTSFSLNYLLKDYLHIETQSEVLVWGKTSTCKFLGSEI